MLGLSPLSGVPLSALQVIAAASAYLGAHVAVLPAAPDLLEVPGVSAPIIERQLGFLPGEPRRPRVVSVTDFTPPDVGLPLIQREPGVAFAATGAPRWPIVRSIADLEPAGVGLPILAREPGTAAAATGAPRFSTVRTLADLAPPDVGLPITLREPGTTFRWRPQLLVRGGAPDEPRDLPRAAIRLLPMQGGTALPVGPVIEYQTTVVRAWRQTLTVERALASPVAVVRAPASVVTVARADLYLYAIARGQPPHLLIVTRDI